MNNNFNFNVLILSLRGTVKFFSSLMENLMDNDQTKNGVNFKINNIIIYLTMFSYSTTYMCKNFLIFFFNLIAFLLRISTNILKFLKNT
jgi:hypothetical protein